MRSGKMSLNTRGILKSFIKLTGHFINITEAETPDEQKKNHNRSNRNRRQSCGCAGVPGDIIQLFNLLTKRLSWDRNIFLFLGRKPLPDNIRFFLTNGNFFNNARKDGSYALCV